MAATMEIFMRKILKTYRTPSSEWCDAGATAARTDALVCFTN